MAMRVTPFTPVLPNFPSSPGHLPGQTEDPPDPPNPPSPPTPPTPPEPRSSTARSLRQPGSPSSPRSTGSRDTGRQDPPGRPFSPGAADRAEQDEDAVILNACKRISISIDSEQAEALGNLVDPGHSPRKRHAIRAGTNNLLKKERNSANMEPRCKRMCRALVENKWFVTLTTLLTIYALVGDDFRLLATNKPADDIFNVLTLTCLVIFLVEIVTSCIGKNDYFLGFFFVLDVVSTFTLVLDLTWVAESLLGDGEGVDKLRSGRTARVGAKAGRVVRVIRLVRIIKLWKAIQDAKMERQRRENEKNGEGNEDDWGEDEPGGNAARLDANGQVRESRVGRKLSEMTTRRVIILVLTMLLVLPFLQTDSSLEPPQSPWYAADNVYELFLEWNATGNSTDQIRYERALLKYLYYFNWFSGSVDGWVSDQRSSPRDFLSHVFWVGLMSQSEDVIKRPFWANATQLRSVTVAAWEEEVATTMSNDIYVYGGMPTEVQRIIASPWRLNTHCDSKPNIFRFGISVLSMEIDGKVSYAVPCPENLRFSERTKYYPRSTTEVDYDKWHFAFYFDTRGLSRAQAQFGLITTVFICIVLCVASLYFSNDANRMILRPVENMVKRVEMIRHDPLIAVQMADEEFKLEEQEKAKLKRKKGKQFLKGCQEAISCFGNTAHEPMETVILEKTIIKLGSLLALGFGEAGANIIGHNLESSDSAGVNAMIQGERVEAIIGLARIRDFSTATEVLKAKVMTFVNQIAEIVHGVVSEFHGAANKNNGDTFLLIWRLSGLDDQKVCRMADMSTIAFAKILGAVHQSPILASYRGHPALQQRLGGNCRVCVTLGLHAGWAIEGAVGSEFKIDASYLSPNVSIAVQVEQATNIYTVPILITEQVMKLCCPEMQLKYRKIDRVVIRGSADPTCLFCLDLDYLCLNVDYDMSARPLCWNSRWRFKARQFLELEKSRKLGPEARTVEMFEGCPEITRMRHRFSMEFLQLFNMGFQNYMEGEWQVAGGLLKQTRWMLNVEDGPSSALLRFMENSDYAAPSYWSGLHDLQL